MLSNGSHYNSILQHAWDKYGSEAFSFELVKEVPDSILLEEEARVIGAFSSLCPNGFNLTLPEIAGWRAIALRAIKAKRRTQLHKDRQGRRAKNRKIREKKEQSWKYAEYARDRQKKERLEEYVKHLTQDQLANLNARKLSLISRAVGNKTNIVITDILYATPEDLDNAGMP